MPGKHLIESSERRVFPSNFLLFLFLNKYLLRLAKRIYYSKYDPSGKNRTVSTENMGTKGEQTREHILATAQSIILQRGYAGTSIEDIISKAGITKGGFFYHFDGKKDLARHLMQRYLVQYEAFFNSLVERAETLSEDPLQRLLIFLMLLAEAMADLPCTHPGCLVASFTYESQQFDDDVRELSAEGMLAWRRIFMRQLERAREKYPLKVDRPLEEIADMLTSIIEGGIIMAKVLDDQHILPNQLLQYRNYLRLAFGDL